MQNMYDLTVENGGWVRALQFNQEMLISGHGDGIVRCWNFNKNE